MHAQWPQQPDAAGDRARRAQNGANDGAPDGAEQPDEQSDDFASHEVRVDAVDVTQTVKDGLPLIGQRKALLDDVSITLLPGTFVAIVGASGSGKTSLLRARS
ncbi:MAG TPA: ATP-binding cassette domain-containing protein, partial [Ktedonobacterales bacterium]|nr:ATP-binding cassette domain-containing protein [Ktedonobacterales bacterium]